MKNCHCGHQHKDIPIEVIELDQNVLELVPGYLEAKNYRAITVVCDANTYLAAGKHVNNLLEEAGFNTYVCCVKPNDRGEVAADERSLVQVLLETPEETDAILAVGAGTLHDITRFVCYQRKLPMISVPTAASVDGFTSAGAPLIIRGFKQTIQTVCPIAVFADLDVLLQAQQSMTAAGLGDMLGKFTSLADWKISNLLGNEPYCSHAAEVTKEALEGCVENIEAISRSDLNGIKILMEALITSGIVMVMLGHSKPASGAEHHLSHYWEMEYLRRGKAALLHGAKVGVATIIMSSIYRQMADGKHGLTEMEHWEQVRNIYATLPEQEQLQKWLRSVNGPVTAKELGISDELLTKSLYEAHTLRERYTGLKLLNNNDVSPIEMYYATGVFH
nr:sn-glycerol-1-phosphate dehydrogenase [Thalassobacillus pellis]